MTVNLPPSVEEKAFSPVELQPKSAASLVWLLGGAVVIGVLLSFLVSIVQVAATVDTRAIFLGLDGLRFWIATGLLTVALMTGFIIWRRPRISVLGIGLLTVGLVGFAATRVVRIESFYGNMVPRLAWSWTPVEKNHFADYQLTKPVSIDRAAAVNELEAAVVDTTDFPQFLGKNRNGVVETSQLDGDWNTQSPELVWRKPVGVGWAGFSIVDGLAFTQEQRGALETVVAYDVNSGEEVWVHGDPVRFEDEHGDGPRSVPTFHAGRLYAIGATGLLNCLEARTGRLIWQQSSLDDPDANNLLWGMCGAPLIVDGNVIVTPGGGESQAIKAFRCDNGQPVFAKGDDPTAYASPSHVTLGNTSQLLCFSGAGLRGYSIDGDPLWLFPWITQGEKQRVNVAQPIVVHPAGKADGDAGYVLVSSGYGVGISLVRVSRADTGDWQAEPVWTSKTLKSKMSNFVVHDQFIYGFDNGIFSCVDLNDGSRVWKRGRYGHGQVLLVGDKLLVQTESGEVVLVQATPEAHRELGTLQALADKTWNHAALADNLLIVRNDREAACYRLP